MSPTETMHAESSAAGAMRRCIVTRESLPTARLVRFVIGPGDEVVPDIRAKLPGRGLWLSARRDIVDRACASNLFAKAARRPAVVPGGLSDRVERLLGDRCIEVIGMARRAGQAVAGFEKARSWLRSGKAGIVVTAREAAPGGRAKLIGPASGVTVVDALSASELGRVFARAHVVHVAIGSGELARRLVVEANRLAGFRTMADSGKLD